MTPADYYEVLGIAPAAEPAAVRAAYKRLAFQYHPDRNSDPAAERMMRLLNEAYAVLSDPARRLAYDAARRTERARARGPAPQGGAQGCSTPLSILGLLGILFCLNHAGELACVAAPRGQCVQSSGSECQAGETPASGRPLDPLGLPQRIGTRIGAGIFRALHSQPKDPKKRVPESGQVKN